MSHHGFDLNFLTTNAVKQLSMFCRPSLCTWENIYSRLLLIMPHLPLLVHISFTDYSRFNRFIHLTSLFIFTRPSSPCPSLLLVSHFCFNTYILIISLSLLPAFTPLPLTYFLLPNHSLRSTFNIKKK